MEAARAAQQVLDTHARRLDAAQRTWRQVVASLGPGSGDAPPDTAVDAEQLVNHVVKLLYHLVASSDRLTPELSGRLTACVLPEKKLVSVSAKRQYLAFRPRKRG